MNDIEKAIEFYKAKSYEEGGIRDRYTRLAIEALKKQLNNGWIPVGERLPDMDECHKNDNRFIVTDGNRRYQDWFDYEEGYFTKCECNGLGLKKDKCVIAWQPLPPAYVEVENEH